ncbi:MAG: AIPR family protein, partial [Deltaproteobacteria bacterium]|nr:AIPR family protein [Deltaproteobacteria bacterium]
MAKRRKINSAIRSTVETRPSDFWVFNNGITLLTLGLQPTKDGTRLTGISIINGAQTTGSIGSVDVNRHDLKEMKVLCRIIQCNDQNTISDIVKYNNTQNEITTWDRYSNDVEQNRIQKEFDELGHSYSRKRGFRLHGEQIGIEEVVQPLIAFYGRYHDASRGKNEIFERRTLYNLAFQVKKARHILFIYTLARSIDARRIELKNKSNSSSIISIEEEQLSLLRSMRFKYFFMAVVGRSIETILGRKISLETVAFSSDAAHAANYSIVALAAFWSPVVEAILSYIATQTNDSDFATRLNDEDILDQISKPVKAMLYASRSL